MDRVVMGSRGGLRKLRGKMRNPSICVLGKSGYRCYLVGLCREGVNEVKLVHRLVLEAFVGPCPDKKECCHNNGNSLDNRLTNLRWDTRRANCLDSALHGTKAMRGVRRSDGVKFASLADAGRSIGKPYQNVSAVCNGRVKTAGGFGWEFT